MRTAPLALAALLAAAPAAAAPLDPTDPGDAAIMRGYDCARDAKAAGFSPGAGARCARAMAAMERALAREPVLTPAQRNKVALARVGFGLSILGTEIKGEGGYGSRACARLPALRRELGRYRPGASPAFDRLRESHAAMLATADAKCP